METKETILEKFENMIKNRNGLSNDFDYISQDIEVLKDFLSKALDEQREEMIKEIEKMELNETKDKDAQKFFDVWNSGMEGLIYKIKKL